MRKEINILLFGFLIFIIGLLIMNFELVKFKYVDYLPDDYKMEKETFTLDIDAGKKYIIQKATFNSNIMITKDVIGGAADNVITIDVYHTKTSNTYNILSTDGDTVNVVFSNELKMGFNDIKGLYNLAVNCIKDKTIYNYNLLKYSKIVIKGSEKALSEVEIEKYDK